MVGFITVVVGVIMSLSPLFQIRKCFEARHANDISLSHIGVITIGAFIWLIYGLSIGNTVLIASNVVGFLIEGFLLGLAIRYRLGAHLSRRREYKKNLCCN